MAKVTLGEVAQEVIERFSGSKENMPIVGLEHLIPGELRLKNYSCSCDNTFTKAFHKGHILFGRRRAYLKKAAVADFDGICSGDITVISAKPKRIVPELLPFIIQNDSFFEYAAQGSAGSLSPRVKWEYLSRYSFDLPSVKEQQKMSGLLWGAYDLKESYKRLLTATDELAKSRFVEMFGDPNSTNSQGKITDGFDVRDDLRKPLNDAVRAQMHTGELYPYYGANGQVDSINKFLFDGTALCLAEDCGSYGAGEQSSYIVSGKCWVNNHAHVLFAKPNCNITFAMFWLNLLDITKFISGTTRTKLTQAQMRKLPFKIPEFDRQNEFAAFIEQLDKSKLALQKSIANADQLLKNLLKESIVG